MQTSHGTSNMQATSDGDHQIHRVVSMGYIWAKLALVFARGPTSRTPALVLSWYMALRYTASAFKPHLRRRYRYRKATSATARAYTAVAIASLLLPLLTGHCAEVVTCSYCLQQAHQENVAGQEIMQCQAVIIHPSFEPCIADCVLMSFCDMDKLCV